jgi:hypothetical protein
LATDVQAGVLGRVDEPQRGTRGPFEQVVVDAVFDIAGGCLPRYHVERLEGSAAACSGPPNWPGFVICGCPETVSEDARAGLSHVAIAATLREIRGGTGVLQEAADA